MIWLLDTSTTNYHKHSWRDEHQPIFIKEKFNMWKDLHKVVPFSSLSTNNSFKPTSSNLPSLRIPVSMYGYLRFLYELTELPVCWLYPIRLTCYLILELYTIAASESLSQLFYGSGVDMSFWSIHSVGSYIHPALSLGHHHSHLRSLPSYLHEVSVFLAKTSKKWWCQQCVDIFFFCVRMPYGLYPR